MFSSYHFYPKIIDFLLIMKMKIMILIMKILQRVGGNHYNLLSLVLFAFTVLLTAVTVIATT